MLGEEGRRLEEAFAAYCGVEHAVGVASGTDAIELALRALGIGAGHEVVTQANTCVPTVAAIERAGATPVLCDVEPEAGTMIPDSLAQVVGERTGAVVPVHLYGQCADMAVIRKIAAERGIPVVEDCAQAHGAELEGARAGSWGALGCFSFYPTKNLGGLGDGGMVVTADAALADRLRLLRDYGRTDRYRHAAAGANSRLDELQAAVLRVKLPRLDAGNQRRAQIAAAYREALADTPVEPLRQLPRRRHVHHLFVVRAPHRGRFQAELRRCGVETLIHYPYPIHRQPAYEHLAGRTDLTGSERLAEQVVSLPLYPELTDSEVEAVAAAAADAARAG